MTRDRRPGPRARRRRSRQRSRRAVGVTTAVTVGAVAFTAFMSSSGGAALGSDPAAGLDAVRAVAESEPVPDPEPDLGEILPDLAPAQPAPARPAPGWAATLPADTTQVVRTVETATWCDDIYCTRTEAWEKVDGAWRLATAADGRKAVFRSTIGPRGFAAPGKRRTNDNKTPSGIYGIAVTFSTTKAAPTDMPWRPRLPTSNVGSSPGRTYNTWIEDANRADGDRDSMRWGFWMDYNNPRQEIGQSGPKPDPRLGSGIFYHTGYDTSKWAPTYGCVALGKVEDMKWVVQWLDPDANPRVVNNI